MTFGLSKRTRSDAVLSSQPLRGYLGADRLLDSDGSVRTVSVWRALGRRVWWQVWPWYTCAALLFLWLIRRGNDPLWLLPSIASLVLVILVLFWLLGERPPRNRLFTVAVNSEVGAQLRAPKLRNGALGALAPMHSILITNRGLVVRLRTAQGGTFETVSLRDLGIAVRIDVTPGGLVAGCVLNGPSGSHRVRAVGRMRPRSDRPAQSGEATQPHKM